MTTFTYEIVQLICEQKIDGKPDAVSGVHLELTASNESRSQSTLVYVPIEISGANFTAFDQLTDQTVRSWIDARPNILDSYKINLEMSLSESADPTRLTKSPPWAVINDTPPAITYQEQRRNAYPYLGDQMDMLWHAMDTGVLTKVTDFYNALKAVKDQYPKT